MVSPARNGKNDYTLHFQSNLDDGSNDEVSSIQAWRVHPSPCVVSPKGTAQGSLGAQVPSCSVLLNRRGWDDCELGEGGRRGLGLGCDVNRAFATKMRA